MIRCPAPGCAPFMQPWHPFTNGSCRTLRIFEPGMRLPSRFPQQAGVLTGLVRARCNESAVQAETTTIDGEGDMMKKTCCRGASMKALRFIGAAALFMGLAGMAQAEIRIGSSVSATGFAAYLGEPEARTLRMLVDDINEAGGIEGEKIRLISYDDGGDPNKARTFATRLIEDDEVVAIVGGTTTGTSMAIIPVAEEAEVPFVSLAGAIEIIKPVRPHTFKTPHTDRMACAKLFEDMKARQITQIGLISGSDGFGSSMRKQCLDIIGEYGLTVLGDEVFGPTDADMTPQLTNLKKRKGIQAILCLGLGSGPAIVARNHAQLAIDLPLYQSHGVASDAFIELAGHSSLH